MYWWIYSAAINLYGLGIRITSLWSDKAKKWVDGRKAQLIPSYQTHPIWFHVASLGEFEQARPVIEAIRERSSSSKILLSFFSPSGYEQKSNYEKVDNIIYLPLDTPKNAKMLLERINPKLIIFTKYDLWFNLIRQAQQADVPCMLISGVFRSGQLYFSFLGKPMLEALRGFSQVLVQDEESLEIAKTNRLTNVRLSGDTRIDRVLEINRREITLPAKVLSFAKDHRILILGSSWEHDEELLIHYLSNYLPPDWKVIIAPHEVSASHLKKLENLLKEPYVRLGRDHDFGDKVKYLIIDSIGLLSKLYSISDIAFIGGGFGSGIHNTLEPAAAGLPIIFGPKYKKFNEAKDMVALGTAFSVSNASELHQILSSLWSRRRRKALADRQREYMSEQSGATSEILALLMQEGYLE